MSRSTYFFQECPTCGRALQVRVEYLGKRIACQHCHGEFEACDPESAPYPCAEPGVELLRRADELLNRSQRRRVRPR